MLYTSIWNGLCVTFCLRCTQDVAGNINVADNYSLITVSIIDNPSDGVLMPLYHRVVIPDAYATLVNGSVYVTVTGAAGNLYGTDWLDHGDVVEFGVVNEVCLFSFSRVLAMSCSFG
jgi:hypothetical protein